MKNQTSSRQCANCLYRWKRLLRWHSMINYLNSIYLHTHMKQSYKQRQQIIIYQLKKKRRKSTGHWSTGKNVLLKKNTHIVDSHFYSIFHCDLGLFVLYTIYNLCYSSNKATDLFSLSKGRKAFAWSNYKTAMR